MQNRLFGFSSVETRTNGYVSFFSTVCKLGCTHICDESLINYHLRRNTILVLDTNGDLFGQAETFAQAKAMQLAALSPEMRDKYAGIDTSSGLPLFFAEDME